MKRTLSFFLVFFSIHVFFGQDKKSSEDQLELLENIHLHLNKTTFLQGERLWFKGYIRNQNSKQPSLETTNLHVGIYTEEGKEVKRKLLYVENGMTHGDFEIDSTLTDNEYTILAWTNYMRNFKKLSPFQQRIKIVKNDMKDDSRELNMSISVYPEGGQLIVGAYNNIGILIDNGRGQGMCVDNLELIDEAGNVIQSNISTNDFGMGKTGFVVDAQKGYFLRRIGQRLPTVQQKLPAAIVDQLGLNVDNNGVDKVLLKLIASKETFLKKDGDIYTIAFYQDDFIRFMDIQVNKNEQVFSIDRAELPFGIVTATLFDSQLRPISYRMFFNHQEDNKRIQDIEVEHCLTEFGDSLQVDLILPNEAEEAANISFSALPSGSDAYHPNNSIVSSFLLGPYVKKYFKEYYFFEGRDRKKRYELDNRLLIEGWGKYDWDSRKQEQVEKAFNLESGIPFKGRVIDANLKEENQISIVAELSAAIGFEQLGNDKSFNGNMVLFQGDSLAISLISKKGRLRKSKAEIEFLMASKEVTKNSIWPTVNILERQVDSGEEIFFDQPLNIDERKINLEEVVVTDKRIKKKRFQISALVEGRLIDDFDIKSLRSVTAYIIKLGFILRGNNGEVKAFVRVPPGLKEAPILINGTGKLPGEIFGKPLSNVKSIVYSKDRNNPFIAITLNSNDIDPKNRNRFVKFAIENGYSRPQEYFLPNYPDYDEYNFKNYGALDWKANIKVGSEIPTSIIVPIKNQPQIRLYIEGTSLDGLLITEQKSIEIY